MQHPTETPAIKDRRLIEGEQELDAPCAHPGCQHATTGGKPYCVDHIHRMPYVSLLGLALLRRARLENGRGRRRAVA